MALVEVREDCCLDAGGYGLSEDLEDTIYRILRWSEKWKEGLVIGKSQEWHLVSDFFNGKGEIKVAFILQDGEC